MVAEIDQQRIREHIIESLSWVRDVERAAVDRQIDAHSGDLRIDSKEGEAICVLVENALGLGELVQASDLKPNELSSVSSLTRLFEERIAGHLASGKGRSLMHPITQDNLSHAWAAALSHLVEHDGKAVHLAVAIQRPSEPEDEQVRAVLDASSPSGKPPATRCGR